MTMIPVDLTGQFILCKASTIVPEGWKTRQQGEWYLGSPPTLPVINILSSDSYPIGWLLGWAISSEGKMVDGSISIDIAADGTDVSDQFENWLYEHAGRFAAVCLLENSLRFYLDPIGSLAAVCCPEQKIVASTPTLVPYSKNTVEDFDLIQKMGIPEKYFSWCPFGTTPRKNVVRAMPNHFVDLKTWKIVRHWPKGDFTLVNDPIQAVEEVASLLKRTISAIALNNSLNLPLTAGHDSRMLLACSREYVDQSTFYTYGLPDGHKHELGLRDIKTAEHIASSVGLEHIFLPFQEPSKAEVDVWLYRTGKCIGGLPPRFLRVYTRLDNGRPILHGAAGELGRGFHWRRGDTESSVIKPSDLLNRREIPLIPVLENRAKQWLDSLPVDNSLTIWGLLYNEEFNGCWMSPGFYGDPLDSFIICPFSHRRILEILFSLPAGYRRENRFANDVIQMEWPELNKLPFNWPIGIRRYIFAVERRFKLLLKKMHQKRLLR